MTNGEKMIAAMLLTSALAGGIAFAAAEVGKRAPAWTLKDINGRTVKLADFKGKKGVLLVFFATWCPHCMEEVPELKAFKERFKERRIEVIGIAVHQRENVIRQFAQSRNVNYTLVLDPNGKVAQTYKVWGIPLLFGIDGNGFIRYKAHRLPKRENQEELVRQLESGTATKEANAPEGVAT